MKNTRNGLSRRALQIFMTSVTEPPPFFSYLLYLYTSYLYLPNFFKSPKKFEKLSHRSQVDPIPWDDWLPRVIPTVSDRHRGITEHRQNSAIPAFTGSHRTVTFRRESPPKSRLPHRNQRFFGSASSLPAARIFVSFLPLHTFTTRSFSLECSPTIIPSYTSTPGSINRIPLG